MTRSANLLLGSLHPSDLALIQPHLKPMDMPSNLVLFDAGGKVDAVYFPTTAMLSLVVLLDSGEAVEAAMVGRDGVIGASAALDGRTSLSRGIVQLSGHGFSCEPKAFKSAVRQSEHLLSVVVRHEQMLYAQAQQSCACMAKHTVDQRFCRWLLRCRDLNQSDDLPFTQDFLAEMLGVRRTSVTEVARAHQQAGHIRYSRGRIRIADAAGLEQASCECYAAVNNFYAELRLWE